MPKIRSVPTVITRVAMVCFLNLLLLNSFEKKDQKTTYKKQVVG